MEQQQGVKLKETNQISYSALTTQLASNYKFTTPF